MNEYNETEFITQDYCERKGIDPQTLTQQEKDVLNWVSNIGCEFGPTMMLLDMEPAPQDWDANAMHIKYYYAEETMHFSHYSSPFILKYCEANIGKDQFEFSSSTYAREVDSYNKYVSDYKQDYQRFMEKDDFEFER